MFKLISSYKVNVNLGFKKLSKTVISKKHSTKICIGSRIVM